MASSRPLSNSDALETSYIEMRDEGDAYLVGKHCQYEYCRQLDFLPFVCQSCSKTFCLDHRTEMAHECSKAGAWAERRRKAQLSQPFIGQGKMVHDRVSQKPCASPECKTTVGTSLAPGVHCKTCNRDYCLKHRLQEDHACSSLKPLGLRATAATTQADVAQRTRSALDRLRAWGSAKREQAEGVLPKPKPKNNSAAARVAAVNKLKKTAQGRSDVPEEKRIYLYVEAEAQTAKAKLPKGDFYYSQDWVVGRMLDEAARSLQVQNINNRSSDEKDRLRVFHVEGGRMLDFGEKLGATLQSGNTVVLLRGVGPPPNLIEA
ncbi:hypothetical protein CDD82_56 [Ophiocordyceps australis]|uniref:AN1-type domain-containing protein n=1 Tax=Ophiocordyceps australis TaxID=1399860 RepID=A0A2C5ZN97_9HYPO|nr:hypothetical protein CDD82_56 [Ophiocordyceps australis]